MDLEKNNLQTGREQERDVLLSNIDKLHTTQLGVERIKRNLSLHVEDVICWCKNIIQSPQSEISRRGKNWYIENDKCVITVNAYSYTIITCHVKSISKRRIGYDS